MKTLFSIISVGVLMAALSSLSCASVVQNSHQALLEKREALEVQNNAQKYYLQTVASESNHEANEAMQNISRASKIMGTAVKNANGIALGVIIDLVLSPGKGQVVYAVLAVGGTLGLGDKFFAIPWSALKRARDAPYYVLDMDKTIFDTSPGFDPNHWPDSINQLDIQRKGLNQFYDLKP
ncbi:PRC-barrel domain-containing protein [Crenothrix polyspora]|uniref:PRC-barrel domain protein n=1 Tax=Crenothrix polyspora TaxID=360316 RepID=A0A1R4HGS3_9GAMM|nr:PRC-barrel domain-containing protein [Crenothrix polyspora]SJM95070.1 PRC-barrel domain protein [Crenothrix polyspora]